MQPLTHRRFWPVFALVSTFVVGWGLLGLQWKGKTVWTRSTWNSDVEQVSLNPYPLKPKVTFKRDGTFKLTVFSDIHFGENPWDDWGPEQDRKSLLLMRKVLAEEKPDFAVINGDLMTGENTFRDNNTRIIEQYVQPFNEAKVPFCTTQGNHDNQVNITHLTEIEHEQRLSRYSYTRSVPRGIGGTHGPGNYWVPVFKNSKDLRPVLILWFFDSRGGFNSTNQPVPDWVDPSVAEWMASEISIMNSLWGPSSTRSAVAFVHIPPQAIQALQSTVTPGRNPGLNEDLLGKGSAQATSNPDDLYKDKPFWDALTSIQSLRVIISGHDHGNEWCAREKEKGVVFCFDKHSGYGGYSGTDWGHGIRNLLFTSPEPQADIQTWIWLYEEGQTRAKVVLNGYYDH